MKKINFSKVPVFAFGFMSLGQINEYHEWLKNERV